MYIPKKVQIFKPAKFCHPLYMNLQWYEIFCYSYGMFKENLIDKDFWVSLNEMDERYVGVWYMSAYRRDADYIRCLRYLLIEAYHTEFVFTTEEPIYRLKHIINVKIDNDGRNESGSNEKA